jgi:drug/metabolite transporter (DMT)-like permease
MVVAVVLWTAMERMGVLLPVGVSIPTLVVVRYSVHLVVLLQLAVPRSGARIVRTRRPVLQIGRGLLMLAMPLCFAAALGLAGPQAIWGVFWVTPLLIVGLATLVLREAAGPRQWIAALVGSAGAWLIERPTPAAMLAAGLPALGMALCFSLYLVLTRKLRVEPVETNLFYTAASVLLPLALAAPLFWHTPPLAAWPVLVAIGLIGLGSLYAFDRACEVVPLALSAPIVCLEPVIIAVLTMLLLGYPLGRAAITGSVFVLMALAIGLLRRPASGPGRGNAWERRERAI